MDNSSTSVIIVAIIGLLSSCISAVIGAFATITAANISIKRHANEVKVQQSEKVNENKEVFQQIPQRKTSVISPNAPSQTKTKLSGWLTVATIIFALCFSCYCGVSFWLWNYGDAYLKQFMNN